MPLYLYRAAYTRSRWRRRSRSPKDRLEVVRPVLDAVGAKLLVAHPFGEYDVLAVYEAPDDAAAAAVALAFAAGGAIKARRPPGS